MSSKCKCTKMIKTATGLGFIGSGITKIMNINLSGHSSSPEEQRVLGLAEIVGASLLMLSKTDKSGTMILSTISGYLLLKSLRRESTLKAGLQGVALTALLLNILCRRK